MITSVVQHVTLLHTLLMNKTAEGDISEIARVAGLKKQAEAFKTALESLNK